ncbi:MAG: DUF6895 family protein [Pyrinomonadaceae bacterium]
MKRSVVVADERDIRLPDLVMASATEELRARDAAIERGLEFVYRFGSEGERFANYGSFLICCFVLVGATSRNPKLRRLGRDRAKHLLRRWSRMHPSLPSAATSDLLLEFVLVRYALSRIGVRDPAGASQIRDVTRRFSALDLLGFEPVTEPPPDDLPYPCDCSFQNPRGRKVCKQCKRRLRIQSRYRVWMEALANTYVAERCGVLFGARYADVLKWMPFMRPYPVSDQCGEEVVRDAIYAVTHIVYTLNDYNTYRLSPRWLPREFAYLKANVETACAQHDAELLGELLDSLKAFGLPARHPLIQRGTGYLLTEQNEDGSWGDPQEENLRRRCHTTWTAIDGLRSLAWRGERLSLPALKPLLKRTVTERS